MNSSDQRRKRKRILRQSDSSLSYLLHLLSVRSIVLCFSFLTFLYLLSHAVPISSSAFHPVLVVSGLSLLSSSSSRTVKTVEDLSTFELPLRVENRVFFPDHVLLLVCDGRVLKKSDVDGLECIYYGKERDVGFDVRKVLSVDEYDELRSIVRCPLPSSNHSDEVSVRWNYGNKNGVFGQENNGGLRNNISSTIPSYSWNNVVYAATLDKDSAIVLVKGLNLRPDRESDPSQFTCHFGLEKWGEKVDDDGNKPKLLITRANSAAQEVIRCPLPHALRTNPIKATGVKVTIGVSHYHGGHNRRALMPSVAKITPLGEKHTPEKRHSLCVCTMAWNQASAMREWITYHSYLGVEKWFVYDNNSDDSTDEVVQELDALNYNVTRHVWPWIKSQEAGFSHCALRSRRECKWVAFMDVDEYFYFPYNKAPSLGEGSLRTLVANFSASSRAIAELRTSCHSFGPSGLNSQPPQGVTVGYTCRLQRPERHKSIVRPEALDLSLLNVVHHFRLRKGFRYVNLPQSGAVINHYKYQVWDVFRTKFYRRVATYVADWKMNMNEGSRDRAPGLGTEAVEPPDWAQRFCEVWDTGLRDFMLTNMVDSYTGLLPWEGTGRALL